MYDNRPYDPVFRTKRWTEDCIKPERNQSNQTASANLPNTIVLKPVLLAHENQAEVADDWGIQEM